LISTRPQTNYLLRNNTGSAHKMARTKQHKSPECPQRYTSCLFECGTVICGRIRIDPTRPLVRVRCRRFQRGPVVSTPFQLLWSSAYPLGYLNPSVVPLGSPRRPQNLTQSLKIPAFVSSPCLLPASVTPSTLNCSSTACPALTFVPPLPRTMSHRALGC